MINDECSICSQKILFRKNSRYPKNDLCSTCWKDYGQKNIRNQSHSSGVSYNYPRPRLPEQVNEDSTWGEVFHQAHVSKYSKIPEEEEYSNSSCKVSSTTYIPERPSLIHPRSEFRNSPIRSPEPHIFSRFQLEKKIAVDETKRIRRHKEIVFDGETHSNKKLKLIDTRKEDLEPVLEQNHNDSFSSSEGDLVIDYDFIDKAENDGVAIEVLFREPLVSRDPRLRGLSSERNGYHQEYERNLTLHEESVTVKNERMDKGYSQPRLNLNPFMLETCVEGIKFMAELDTTSIDLQISMDVAEIIQKEVLKNPLRIDHRNGWSNIYPGKVVPVSVDVNNFLHVVPGTLRSDISYKIILGREVLVTFGYNFSVCGLPVKQKA